MPTIIQPLTNRILVKPKKPFDPQIPGFVIPDCAQGEEPVEGEVLALGTRRDTKGRPAEWDIAIGDTVVYRLYAGAPIHGDVILKPDDILGSMAGTTGAAMISAERRRQQSEKGYSAAHDDTHTDGALAFNAAILATEKIGAEVTDVSDTGISWWQIESKQKTRIEYLTIAGALIAAEIDRLTRAENSK